MLARFLLTALLLCLVSPAFADDVYRLDGRNTEVGFVGTKKDGKHEGGFKELKGTVTVKEGNLETAQFKVDIDMRSMFTDNDQLTNHLKSPDFFNVQKNPVSKFVSTKIEKNAGKYNLHGKLTMNGVTKEVVVPVTMELTGPGLSIESNNWEISRHDWKISYRPKDIDEKVKLSLKVLAPK